MMNCYMETGRPDNECLKGENMARKWLVAVIADTKRWNEDLFNLFLNVL